MVGTIIGEYEQGPDAALSRVGASPLAMDKVREVARKLSFGRRPINSTAAQCMASTVMGEKEERPDPARSGTGFFLLAKRAHGAAAQPSFWFGAAIVAGALSVGLAAWGAMPSTMAG